VGMMMMIHKRKFIPEGVEDINFTQYEKKEYIQAKIKDVFKGYGYRQILTPTFEFYDLFSEIETAIVKEEMYKIIDPNGKILVLRPDATLPIARMVATQNLELENNLKYMYFTSVYRSADFRAGGKREFTQAGVESYGNASLEADAEIIDTAVSTLSSLGLDSVHIDIGQTDYFRGIINELTVDEDIKDEIRELIENKSFAELGNLLKTLEIEVKYKKVLLEVPFLYGDVKEVAEKARKYAINSSMEKAVDNMLAIYDILCEYGCEENVFADMGLVNHLDYYSGMIFKGYISNSGIPVVSGGRYDDLLEKFGKEIPAVGFGINIDEVLDTIIKSNKIGDYEPKIDFLLLYDKENRRNVLRESKELRNKGLTVETDAFVGTLEEQNDKYSNKQYIKKIAYISNKTVNIES